ncbi:MAG TPA: FAD-dependent thymidylate synthase [Dehalococcoidia bacterium]|nr:FAD-dependent thymidylate synthase [Dehalococcoidia bacterium]
MAINVRLIDHTSDPARSLYVAYRTAYSALTPQTIVDRIASDRITREQMWEFIEKRLETGHASPLEQVWFEFAISGVSRAFSHQFVRHKIGISFEQQSQRYVAFKKGEFPYTVPETVKRAGFGDKMEEAFDRLGELYQEMIEAGIPAEDARFLIPNAANTNFKVVVNFLELLHICDLRLCTRAQWEFRQVASQMRAQIHRAFPELAQYIQPKCGDKRWGYCDESLADWQACPIGKKRPHKKQLFELYDAHRRGELAPLADDDFTTIEQIGSSVATAGSAKPAAPKGREQRAVPETRDEG